MPQTRYWLMKTEPQSYSIDDLERDGRTGWDGVRNYQARNFMRDQMRIGDGVLFYHSWADPSGVAGLAEVCRTAYPDGTAQDRKSEYYDASATPENPIWLMVDLKFVEKWPAVVSLEMLKSDPALDGLLVLKRGQRLSVMPVEPAHFRRICELGRGARKERRR